MADFRNPFLGGFFGAQNQAQRGTMNQIGAAGGLLALENQMEMAPIQRELMQLKLQNARQGPQPKWQVSERFTQDGRKEKVLVDLNNPSNVIPFGGAEAEGIMSVNAGNQTLLLGNKSGQPRGMPIPIGVSPNTSATLGQNQQQFNQMLPIRTAQAGADLARLNWETGGGPATIPGLTPPPMAPQGAPIPQATPEGMMIPPQVQAQRDAEAARIQGREVTGGGIPTSSVVQGSRPPGAIGPALSPKQQSEKAAKRPERIQSLRKEFDDKPEVKSYRTVIPIIESARNSPDTPAGDLDLIYAVGKILDPTSVVREGEMNLVIKSGSPMQRFQGTANYIQGGGRLTPELRGELTAMLDGRVGQLKALYDQSVAQFTGIANAEGLPLDQVIQALPQSKGATTKKSIKRTGTYNGRKVVEYSDGTVEYQ